MSIAAAVLDAVRAEAALRPGCRVGRAGLRIGELSGVEPESLRFCLEALVSGSDLEPLAFEFELRPWTRQCKRCGEDLPRGGLPARLLRLRILRHHGGRR